MSRPGSRRIEDEFVSPLDRAIRAGSSTRSFCYRSSDIVACAASAIHNLAANTKERSRLALELIDRHEEEKNFIQTTLDVPARDLSSMFNLPKVNLSDSIIKVLKIMEKHKAVLVSGWMDANEAGAGTDVLWSRQTFFEYAIHANMFDPISSIAQSVPQLPTIHANETLDHVMQAMIVSGCDLVGTVNDDGAVTGVLLFEDLYKSIAAKVEDEVPEQNETDKTKNRFRALAEGDSEDGTLQVKTGSEQRTLRDSLQEWVEAPWTEMLIMALLILDVVLTIYETTLDDSEVETGTDNPLLVVTGCILFVYAFEAGVRIFGYRMSLFNGTRLLESIDLLVVFASIIVFILALTATSGTLAKNIVIVARVMRVLRLIKAIRRIHYLMRTSKGRYRKDGFNLDLTYLTPSCIAMCLPAVGAEAITRNPIDDVVRFFTTKHPKHYLLFNLCPERSYDIALFDSHVETIDVEEHNPPMLDQLISYLSRVSSYMDQDPSNVFAVHCISGLGRTGVLVSAWLFYCNFSESADDAMEYFCKLRTGKTNNVEKGISSASQRRYVHYIERVLGNGGYYTPTLVLKSIVMQTCPSFDLDGGSDPWFTLEENGNMVFDWTKEHKVEKMRRQDPTMEFHNLNVPLTGDVRLTFYDRDYHPYVRDEIMFYGWFHTGLVEEQHFVLEKSLVDIASNDHKCRIFKPHFKVELIFEEIPRADKPVRDAQTKLGPWRKVYGPSKNILSLSKRYRGREQDLVTEGREITITLDDGKEDALTPVPDNLCSASGPVVSHESVKIISVASGEVHENANQMAKQLINYYKKGGGDGGLLAKKARALVSGKKKRFQEDGFDLDLTYITPRLIAMGFPSKGMEGGYRNPESEVYRFFQERHAGHFRIFNLCSERDYDLNIFHGSVARYPFPDHNPPALELVLPACAHIHTFLQANENHVCAVHCKAGKGRTGLILIAYLLYGGLRRTALSARAFYDSQRTYDKKGLTIISQIRYTHYFEEQLRRLKRGDQCSVSESKSPAMRLWRVRLNTVPHFDRDGGCDPIVTVSVKSEADYEEYELYRSKDYEETKHFKPSDKCCELDIGPNGEGLRVAGDVHVIFHNVTQGFMGQSFMTKPAKVCHLWVHTCFMQHPPPEMAGTARALSSDECDIHQLPHGTWCLTLSKPEIDQAAQDSKNAKFDVEFSVDIFFSVMPSQWGTGEALKLARAKKSEESGKRKKVVKYHEKEAYERQQAQRKMLGQESIRFEDWLLSSDEAKAGSLSALKQTASFSGGGGGGGFFEADEIEDPDSDGESPEARPAPASRPTSVGSRSVGDEIEQEPARPRRVSRSAAAPIERAATSPRRNLPDPPAEAVPALSSPTPPPSSQRAPSVPAESEELQRPPSSEEGGAMQLTFAVQLEDLQPSSIEVLRRLVQSETAAALSHHYPPTSPVSPVCARLSITEVHALVKFPEVTTAQLKEWTDALAAAAQTQRSQRSRANPARQNGQAVEAMLGTVAPSDALSALPPGTVRSSSKLRSEPDMLLGLKSLQLAGTAVELDSGDENDAHLIRSLARLSEIAMAASRSRSEGRM